MNKKGKTDNSPKKKKKKTVAKSLMFFLKKPAVESIFSSTKNVQNS